MSRYYVVHVDDAVETRLVGDSGCSYVSPPQPRAQALALVRMLLGCAEPAGDGGWRSPAAGARSRCSRRNRMASSCSTPPTALRCRPHAKTTTLAERARAAGSAPALAFVLALLTNSAR